MPPPPAPISELAVKRARDGLREATAQRSSTDIRISPLWVVAALIIVLTSVAILFGLIFIAFFDALDAMDSADDRIPEFEPYTNMEFLLFNLGNVATTSILTMLAYKLVSRQQKHFKRERRVVDVLASSGLSSAGGALWWRSPKRSEAPRSPLFWALVVLAPAAISLLSQGVILDSDTETGITYVILWLGLASFACIILTLYMLYFLTEEMAGHHERWYGYAVNAKRELARRGYSAGHLRTPEPLPDRNSAIYFIATIFTATLFMYYWWYAVVKDGNDHFEEQTLFEDGLLELLERPPPSTGGAVRSPAVTPPA